MVINRTDQFHVIHESEDTIVHLGVYANGEEAAQVNKLGSIGFGKPYGIAVPIDDHWYCCIRYVNSKAVRNFYSKDDARMWLEFNMRIMAETAYVGPFTDKGKTKPLNLEKFLAVCSNEPKRRYLK